MREDHLENFFLTMFKFFNDFNTYFSDTIITELNEKNIFIGNLMT